MTVLSPVSRVIRAELHTRPKRYAVRKMLKDCPAGTVLLPNILFSKKGTSAMQPWKQPCGNSARSVIRMSGTGVNMSTDDKMRALIAALGDPSIEKRHEAIAELRGMGEPAVGPLIASLAGAMDNDHRWYAAVALSRIGGPAIAPLVAAMAENPGRDFRRYAAAALGEIGAPAIDALINGMATDDRELRGFLSQALCRIGKPAVEPLTRRLGDDNEIIRSCATLTLWQMGETGLPSMVKMVQDGG